MAAENQQKKDNQANTVKQEEKKLGIGQAFHNTKVELKKVHWPKKEEVKKYTVVVIATVAFFSVAIYLIDSGLGFVISKLISK